MLELYSNNFYKSLCKKIQDIYKDFLEYSFDNLNFQFTCTLILKIDCKIFSCNLQTLRATNLKTANNFFLI